MVECALLCDWHRHRTWLTKARANVFAKKHVYERSCRIFFRIGLYGTKTDCNVMRADEHS